MIEVRIDYDELAKAGEKNPIHAQLLVQKRLEEAGVPIEPGFIFLRVKRGSNGRLTTYNDEMFDQLVYEWSPE